MINKYIYFDSKISGALRQLINYFNNNIFSKKDVIVIVKAYKENKSFFKELEKNNIIFIKIKRYRDLPNLNNSIIFYLFNAQSNCRIVGYREAKHIFVTHGESNKLSSVKPILRIYDYIIVAGEIGIERLVSSKIFTECDIQKKKIIKMGNTFIGTAKYTYNNTSSILLYAPTWEGGLSEENYTSINNSTKNFQIIEKYAKEHSIKKIILQPHPNLGHRNKAYLYYLYKGIKYLKNNGLNVSLRNWESNIFQKILTSLSNIERINTTENIKVAFCDISAMEVQLLSKNIPTFVFFTERKKAMPKNIILEKYYENMGIYNYKSKFNINIGLQAKVKKLYLSYETTISKDDVIQSRIEWLSNYVSE